MRTPINPKDAIHAHETPQHLSEKIMAGTMFQKFAFDYVLFEHAHADFIGVRCRAPKNEIIAGEVERSTRNLLRNLERNNRQGAAGSIVICPNFAVMAAVARKLARSLPPALFEQVGLTNLTTLQLLTPDFKNSALITGENHEH